jgi:hypothetical protein
MKVVVRATNIFFRAEKRGLLAAYLLFATWILVDLVVALSMKLAEVAGVLR